MRYTGGLNGGSWLTALTGDLGHGIFDGAALVQNFENMNPSNTLWTKQYNLYANIDTEGPRYLGFEKWWGGHVLLNAEEMQWIVDNLFVGNKLATAEIVTGDGVRLDLRNIKSPIICFCSQGDDITPPQQALGWILDLYGSVEDIRANGQTIVYCVHDKIGHLGIFVSGGVAKKEHAEFASNIDFIDCLPPGLYEAVLTPAGEATVPAGSMIGDYVVRFEQRTLDDIRALGCNDLEDERKFAAVARLSEINLGLYRTYLQPWVRAATTEQSAQLLRQLSPSRLQFELFSDKNPLMASVAAAAELARASRRPVAAGNPLPGRPASRLRSGRGGTGRLARLARLHGGGDLPRHLRLAGDPGAAGPSRQRGPAAPSGPAANLRRSRSSSSGSPSSRGGWVREACARRSSARSSTSGCPSWPPTSGASRC